MDAKELMIGNWVFGGPGTEKKQFKVTRDFLYELIGTGNDDYYDPIPITPEILKRAGFEKDGDDYAFDGDGLRITDENGHYYCNGGYPYDVELEFVHQLQNLYFALTGDELEINL